MPLTKVSNTVLNNSQPVHMTDTTDSISTSTGTLVVDGGGAYKKRLSVGTAFLAPVWATSVAYVVGDIVRFDFGLYECKTAHTSGTLLTDWKTHSYWTQLNTPASPVNKFILYNDLDADHDILTSIGWAIDSTDMYKLELNSPIVKKIDAPWSTGTNAGGLFSGTVAASTWYYFFVIRRDSDGIIDSGFDTSAIAANRPAGWTYYRKIGAIRTDSSLNIRRFYQVGNKVNLIYPPGDYTAGNPGTGVVSVTVTAPPNYMALIQFVIYTDSAITQYARYFSLTQPNQQYNVPNEHITSDIDSGAWRTYLKDVLLNSSSQFGYKIYYSYAGVAVIADALAWYENYN